MKFEKIGSMIDYIGPKSKIIERNDNFSVSIIGLKKGQRLDEHTSTVDAFIYVIEGSANFNLEGHANFISEGDGFSFLANQPHSVNALTDFKFILIK